MISGTSKKMSKSGPVALLSITKMLKKTKEIMESSWKHIIYVNMGLNKNRFFRTDVCPRYHAFLFVFCTFCFLCNFEYILLKYLCGGEDWKMINFPLMKCTKAWIWISYLSKNMKWKFGKSSIFIYFQERVSLIFLFSRKVIIYH